MNDKPQEQEPVCPLFPDKYTRVGVIYQRFGGGCCLLWRWARDIIDVLVALALALEFSWSVVDFDWNTLHTSFWLQRYGGKKRYEWRENIRKKDMAGKGMVGKEKEIDMAGKNNIMTRRKDSMTRKKDMAGKK